jgi:uncharacterized protein YeaO (DUF488 family)
LRLCVSRLLSGACCETTTSEADLVSAGKVTPLFGAHDIERNNAVALTNYLAAH